MIAIIVKQAITKAIILPFVVAMLILSAKASVSLQMSYYSSDDSMSVSMDGYNLEFESVCELYPDSITYNNGGSSKQPDTEYSYSISLNDKSAFSSAETDSGKSAWSSNIIAGPSSETLRVVTISEVENGHLSLNYGNKEMSVKETMDAKNAGYSQQARFIDNSVESQGAGSTLQPVPGLAEKLAALTGNANSNDSSETDDDTSGASKGDETSSKSSSTSEQSLDTLSSASIAGDNDQDGSSDEGVSSETSSEEMESQGIKHTMEIAYGKRTGSIETDVIGVTEAQWAINAGYNGDQYVFGTKVRGINTEPMDDLDMTGKAANFPTQILPPGVVKIIYSDEFDPWELVEDKDYVAMVDSEFHDFDTEYSGVSTPALWYSLRNLYYKTTPMTYTLISDQSLGFEIYNFGMGFSINDK